MDDQYFLSRDERDATNLHSRLNKKERVSKGSFEQLLHKTYCSNISCSDLPPTAPLAAPAIIDVTGTWSVDVKPTKRFIDSLKGS